MTLKAMYKLFDEYSTNVNKLYKKADEYMNTVARLDFVNYGMQTKTELQDKIFAAAERTKGSYSNMANAVSQIGLLAGNSFSSNDELIGFTELLQKIFRINGTNSFDQSSATLQLSQAMAAGKLQGDEYQSISGKAPIFTKAIEDYMKNILKAEGNMKDWLGQGLITDEVMKNALFMAADDINEKAEKMPVTFADIWNEINREATKAFGPIIKRVSNIINSEKFQKFMNNIAAGLNIVANAADKALDAITDIYDYVESNWSNIVPIIEAAAAAWLIYRGALLLVKVAQWSANLATLANPIGIVIVLVILLAAAFILLWEKCEWFRKLYISMWKASAMATVQGYNSIATMLNLLGAAWNSSIDMIRVFAYALRIGMIAATRLTEKAITGMIDQFSFLVDAIRMAINAYNAIAKAYGRKTIDFDVNAENLKKLTGDVADKTVAAINASGTVIDNILVGAKVDKPLPIIDINAASKSFNDFGKVMEDFTIYGWIKDKFAEVSETIASLFTEDDNPFNKPGRETDDSVELNMDTDDIRYLRDIAEREYINKFSTATLAPNVQISFGDVHEEADINKLKGTLERMMREEIAVAAEGVF
jgi:tape measure domain-containing protein